MTCTSASFYIKQENLDYISDQVKDRARYNKSNWLDDLVDHLRSKSEGKAEPQNTRVRREVKRAPPNFDECFERLWAAKGKRGAKAKAKEKYKSIAKGEPAEALEEFTSCLVLDIEDQIKSDEIGFRELHLTTYLNQQRWEK